MFKDRNKLSLDHFNFDLMIDIIRPQVLELEEKDTKKLVLKLNNIIKNYLQEKFPMFLSNLNDITTLTYAKMFGLSLIDEYKDLPGVTDIFVFGTKIMYIRNGIRTLAPKRFNSIEEVKVIYRRIASGASQNISVQEPSKDCELYDGSRVLLIIEPEGIEPYIVIRNHTKADVSIDKLVLNGLDSPTGTIIENTKKTNLSEEIDLGNVTCREYLKAAVQNRKNIVFVGGTGSGKTTFMNALSYYIQKNHIVAVLEDTRELSLPLDYVYYLRTRKSDEKTKSITYEDLLRDCLRANPDRIMLTEIRTGESAYTLLHVLNSGHGGSMTSIHADGALKALDRLEELVGEFKDMNILTIRKLISKAIDCIVYLRQDEDENGNKIGRGIKEIVEINGLDNEGNYDYKHIYKNL